MLPVSTARIRANKALQRSCGQECVDWAISMIEQGWDGEALLRLAGKVPPLYHFEIAALRDQVLNEMGFGDLSGTQALLTFAAEELRRSLAGDTEIIHALDVLKDLCASNDYQDDLYEFYLLFHAYSDLQHSEVQFYWPGADRTNIRSIILERSQEFVRVHTLRT